MRLAIAIGALVLATGCHLFEVLGSGQGVACKTDRACPAGMACIAGACTSCADGRCAAPQCAPRIAVGAYHACAVLTDCTLKCWGYNLHGQLGQGHGESRGDRPNDMGSNLPAIDLGTRAHAVDVAAGESHTCALLSDGAVKCWGFNEGGQLGVGDVEDRGNEPGELGDALPVVDLGNGRRATMLVAGGYHNCAALDDGSLKCWGYNAAGPLGVGDSDNRGDESGEMGANLPAVALGTGFVLDDVVAGAFSTCARSDSGQVKCWGNNEFGQLGQDNNYDYGNDEHPMATLAAIDLAPIAQVAAGGAHTCALLGAGGVVCWGNNDQYQLGYDSGTLNHVGSSTTPMSSLHPLDLDFFGITAIAAGDRHNCSLAAGALKCWGANDSGQLGLEDDLARREGAGNMGAQLPVVSLGNEPVAAIAAGNNFNCALLTDGRIKCWGGNEHGQLGLGDNDPRGCVPESMGDNLNALELGAP